MKSLGRASSAIAILGAVGLAFALTMNPDLGQPDEPAIRWIDWIGLLTVVCMFLSWVLALFHWGASTGLANRKTTWGFVGMLGFFLGAAVYFYHPRGAAMGEVT